MPGTIHILTTPDGVTATPAGGADVTFDDGTNTPHTVPGWLLDPNNPPLAASGDKWEWLEKAIKTVINSAKKLWP